jgi:hypothetical protein
MNRFVPGIWSSPVTVAMMKAELAEMGRKRRIPQRKRILSGPDGSGTTKINDARRNGEK